MRVVLDAAPAAEPITTADVKAQLRVDASDEDAYIALCVTTSRVWAEEYINRKLITQTWNLYLEHFPFEIVVPFGSLQSVNTIKYYDNNNDLQTLSAAEYEVDTYAQLGRIRPASGYSWPAVYPRYDAIEVNYDCGYGDAGTDCPAPIIHGLKYCAAQLFEHRESIDGLPAAVRAVLYPYTIQNFAGYENG